MDIIAISKPRNSKEAQLLQTQHELRAKVFSDRLGWEVDVSSGLEFDAFDKLGPTYILAVSDYGTLSGCARLLPASGPTMLSEIFNDLLPEGSLTAHPRMLESSRFCVDTTHSGGRDKGSIHAVTLGMLAGIIEWSAANGFTEIVTVTDLRFERILSRVGWPLVRLGRPKQIGVTMAVAGTLPITKSHFEQLRPPGYRSLISTVVAQAA